MSDESTFTSLSWVLHINKYLIKTSNFSCYSAIEIMAKYYDESFALMKASIDSKIYPWFK